MNYQIIASGKGQDYDWANDHIFVKTTLDLTGGRVTFVEDTLKPGFHLPRHYHKEMIEIFYILEGEIEFKFDDATVIAVPGMTINIPPTTGTKSPAPREASYSPSSAPAGSINIWLNWPP